MAWSETEQPAPQEKLAQLEKFIASGLDLIKRGQFEAAIKHFNNPQLAENFGLEISPSPRRKVLLKTLEPSHLRALADFLASASHFNTRGDGKITLVLSGIATLNEVPEELRGRPLVEVPPLLYHEIALLHAEEWLHALQHFRQSPLAGGEDSEKDVAHYLNQNGVPMTKAFLARYGRGDSLKRKG